MFPSGVWDGFRQQPGYGRQSMTGLVFRFEGGVVTGHGDDIIGPFVLRGECEPKTGRVRFQKRYLGRHAVDYDGLPDGEGSIAGTWSIGDFTGPFLLRPRLRRPTGEEPIREIGL